MQVLKGENLKNAFVQMDTHLAEVEVKGSSVQNIFSARNILMELFKLIEEEIEKKEQVKEEGG